MAEFQHPFIQALTREAFEASLAADKVSLHLIAFIEDTNEIWTRGKYYPCPYTKAEIDKMIKDLNDSKVDVDTYNTATKKLEDSLGELPVADEEDITVTADNKLQLKDRDSSKGMGYKILRLPEDGILTQEMINEPNTIYEIRYDFDLNGSKLIIPNSCILKFEGGSISNGAVEFNKTLIVSSVPGIFTEVYISGKYPEFKTSFVRGDNFDKMKFFDALECDTLEVDEHLFITESDFVHLFNARKILFSNEITLNTDINNFIRNSPITSEIEGLHFNGNGYACQSVVIFNSSDNVYLKNIIITDISCKENQFCTAINITDVSDEIYINKITVRNVSTVGNNVITDSVGNLNGIVISRSNDALISISDCYFENLANYNEEGEEIFEDIGCIYVSRPDKDNRFTYISNIKGYNFGKRLIKSDAGNMIINDIYAENYKEGKCLAVIGMNDGDGRSEYSNVTINNVHFKGYCSYVVASSVHNTMINNMHSEFLKPEVSVPYSMVYANADNITINNAYCKDGLLVTVTEDRSVTVNKAYCIYSVDNLYNTICLYNQGSKINIVNSTFDFNSYNSHFCNYSNFTRNAEICFDNCLFNIDDDSGEPREYIIHSLHSKKYTIYKITNSIWNINSEIRGFIGNVSNLVLKNDTIIWNKEASNTIPGVSLHVMDSSVIEIDNVKIIRNNRVSTLYSYYFNSTTDLDTSIPKEIVLKDIDGTVNTIDNIYWKSSIETRVYREYNFDLGSLAIGCGCYNTQNEKMIWDGNKWIVDYSLYPFVGKGITADRPVNPSFKYTSYLYFDTTLGRPVWWNGTAWIDPAAEAVSWKIIR